MTAHRIPKTILLYAGVDPDWVDVDGLADYLADRVSTDVSMRDDFIRHHLPGGRVAEDEAVRALAEARVQQPDRRACETDPKPAEVDYEKRFLRSGSDKPTGLLYDAGALMRLYGRMLPPAEVAPGRLHIMLTNQLIGSWDDANCRYHARAAVFGIPALISTCGLVEGPAKPREVYMGRQLGMRAPERDPQVREKYLDYDDPRMQEVLKGYLLQAVFYHAAGDPFCEREDCRLYNAHWQEKMLEAQTGKDAGLCAQHRRRLEEWICM